MPADPLCTMAGTGASWYARRNGTVRGPFTADHVKRCILLGRIQLNDELSEDECTWRPLTECPDLLPDELNAITEPEGWERFLLARSRADERVAERRQAGGSRVPAPTDRRRTPDRRISWLTGLRHGPGTAPDRHSLRFVLLAMLLATLVLVYFNAASR